MQGCNQSTIPTKKRGAWAKRAVMADGNEYNVVLVKEAWQRSAGVSTEGPRRSPEADQAYSRTSRLNTNARGLSRPGMHTRGNPAIL